MVAVKIDQYDYTGTLLGSQAGDGQNALATPSSVDPTQCSEQNLWRPANHCGVVSHLLSHGHRRRILGRTRTSETWRNIINIERVPNDSNRPGTPHPRISTSIG
jgi:hypothetical protein